MNGWIKIHRQFMEWEWYTDQNVKSVFLHCLLSANVVSKEWRGVNIDRGSFITSLSKLAVDVGLSIKAVRIALDKLKKTSEITCKGASQWTYVTICNYDKYQSDNTTEGQANGTPHGKRGASEGQARGKRGATTKEGEEGVDHKKEKKVYVFTPPNLEEVVLYFTQNGYTESAAKRAFEYYATNNWVDSKGSKVANWKQKMIAVWFKPEHEVKPKQAEGHPR